MNDQRVLQVSDGYINSFYLHGHMPGGFVGGLRAEIPNEFGQLIFSGESQFRYDTPDFQNQNNATDFEFHEAIYGGFWQTHFGHFLVETISRLWFAKTNDLPIVFAVCNQNTSIPIYAREILDLLEIDFKRIVLSSNNVRVKKLHVPKMCKGIGWLSDEYPEWDELKKNVFKKIIVRPNCENLYFGRSHLLPAPILIGSSFFSLRAKNNNFNLCEVEDFSISERLTSLCSAKKIIYEEGSVCHLHEILPNLDYLRIETIPRSPRRRNWEPHLSSYCGSFKWIYPPESTARTSGINQASDGPQSFGFFADRNIAFNSDFLDLHGSVSDYINEFTLAERLDLKTIENYILSMGSKASHVENFNSISSSLLNLKSMPI